MSRKRALCILVFALMVVAPLICMSSSENPVSFIKNSYFAVIDDTVTIGQALDAVLDNAVWVSDYAAGTSLRVKIVNVSGTYRDQGESNRVLIQFRLGPGKGVFCFGAIEMNGVVREDGYSVFSDMMKKGIMIYKGKGEKLWMKN